MRGSIRNRLTLAFIGLAIGPLLLVGIILGVQSYIAQGQQALNLQSEVAQRVSSEVTAFFTELEQQLRLTSQVQGLQNLDQDEQQSILSELLSYQDVFDELVLLDSQGKEQTRVSRADITVESSGDRSEAEEFVIPLASGQTYYSPVRFDQATGEPLMTIAVPLIDVRSGVTDGVLISEIRIKKIWDLIANLQVSPGQSVYIVDAQDRVIAHRNPSVVLRGTTFQLPGQNGIQPGLGGTIGEAAANTLPDRILVWLVKTAIGGDAVLAVNSIRFGAQEFNIVAEQTLPEALALAITTVRITIGLVVAMLVIAASLGIVSVRQITVPIRSMASTAQAISDGDLSQQVQITSQDELGVLATAFNSMTAQLRGLIGNLEQQVAERTRDLEDAIVEAVKARAAAEEANATKSRFLANMSHELRTPLNAILNFTEFVSEGIYGPVNEKQVHALRQALASGSHLLSLINDVLDITKIEAGMMELFIEEVDFNAVLASTVSVGKGLVKDKPVRLIAEVEDDLPKSFGDNRRLRQVFLNVVSNAAKFTKQGSITLTASRQDGGIEVVIKDTGIGIAPEDYDKVFETFRQAKHDLTGAFGTGLGMPISKHFVEMHGGRIWFESQPNQGTTFYIRLPKLTQEQMQTVSQDVSAPAA
ncbi:MAG: sensor histidine kinase [Anaerolineae bacterium]|nr:sensor histidine kinase [Anaerolineae bacterium]